LYARVHTQVPESTCQFVNKLNDCAYLDLGGLMSCSLIKITVCLNVVNE